MALGARGISVLTASGDAGVRGNHNNVNATVCADADNAFAPFFPASCPFVTAVGSTQGLAPEVVTNFTGEAFQTSSPVRPTSHAPLGSSSVSASPHSTGPGGDTRSSRCKGGTSKLYRVAFFRVDPRKLQPHTDNDPSASELYAHAVRPPFDCSNRQIKGQRDLDLSSFARSEGWYTVIEKTGLTPAEVQEVSRGSTEDDDDLHDVKYYVVQYLADVQPMIEQHCVFGFQHLMVIVRLNQHSLAAFTILTSTLK
ncbi:hypothetical protein DFH09DRAFT_1345507 [Mycena vulgaris]|nr:hypothetical protein DFH09DRAFT_1345507 [Mycena vulgaris]